MLIENFKVGGLAKFGLDYQSLAPDNPRLIYCSVTGFGQDGPYAPRAGYDLMAQGMGGIMDLTGNPDGEPMRAGVPVSDIFTGVYSAVGILAALARREKTGRGGYVDTALVDTTAAILANQALNYLISGNVPRRMGNAHPNIIPYQVFPVADGHIIIASGNDSQFAKLCAVLGEPALAKDPKYIDNKARLAHRAELIGRLCALTAKIPALSFSKNSKPSAFPPARSTISRRSSPIRRCSIAACASTGRVTRPRADRSPACARRSCSTARRWRPNALRRGSANTRARFCAKSARAEFVSEQFIPQQGSLI